jgi:hypothetical protein
MGKVEEGVQAPIMSGLRTPSLSTPQKYNGVLLCLSASEVFSWR